MDFAIDRLCYILTCMNDTELSPLLTLQPACDLLLFISPDHCVLYMLYITIFDLNGKKRLEYIHQAATLYRPNTTHTR